MTGWVPTLLRAGRGMMRYRGAQREAPPQLLQLWDYDGNQFSRLVRGMPVDASDVQAARGPISWGSPVIARAGARGCAAVICVVARPKPSTASMACRRPEDAGAGTWPTARLPARLGGPCLSHQMSTHSTAMGLAMSERLLDCLHLGGARWRPL